MIEPDAESCPPGKPTNHAGQKSSAPSPDCGCSVHRDLSARRRDGREARHSAQATPTSAKDGIAHPNHVLLGLLGLMGIATVFLPFRYKVPPVVGLLMSDVWLLASPFLLAIVISVMSIHWIISGRLSWTEIVVARFLSSAMVLVIVFGYFANSFRLPFESHMLPPLIIPFFTLTTGGMLLFRCCHKGTPPAVSALVSMHTVYVANALLCLFGFLRTWPWQVWQIGAYCTQATCLIYIVHISILVTEVRKDSCG